MTEKSACYGDTNVWTNWMTGTLSSEGSVVTARFEFTATKSAGMSFNISYYHDAPWIVTQSVEYSLPTTLSLRSTNRAATRNLRSTPRNHEVVDTTGATDMGTFVLNAENGWQNIHYELPKYSTDGKYTYTYFVQEITEGYDVTYTNNGGLTEGTITITNHKKQPTTMDMLVNKEWVDESGNKYLLLADMPRYFKLFDGQYDVTESVPGLNGATLEGEYIKLVTPMGKSSASFTLTALPIGGDYSLKEYVLVNGAYTEVTDYASNRDGSTITVTNRLTDITITKTWAANSSGSNAYAKPEVTFELWRTYEGGTDELVSTKVMKNGITTLTWDSLPLTPDGTTPYKYYVKELLPSGFVADNDGRVDVEQGTSGNITNTPTEIKVEKKWQNLNGEVINPANDAVVYYKLMRQKVTVNGDTETKVGQAEAYSSDLQILNSTNDWKKTHTGLPLYWKDTTSGATGEYRYFVTETDQSGKEIHADYTNNYVDVSELETITILNTATGITVKKIWSINGGALPENLPAITLQLRYTHTQGVKSEEDPIYETIQLTAKTEGIVVTSDNEGNVYWTYSWDMLPAYDLVNSEEMARYYYVVESGVPDGFRLVSTVEMNNFGITGNTSDNAIQITNEMVTYELPETGGAGTTPYTVCGLLTLLTAALALMYNRYSPKKLRGEGHES